MLCGSFRCARGVWSKRDTIVSFVRLTFASFRSNLDYLLAAFKEASEALGYLWDDSRKFFGILDGRQGGGVLGAGIWDRPSNSFRILDDLSGSNGDPWRAAEQILRLAQ